MPTRSVWLREFLKGFPGGLIVISHDIELVEETVNKVFYLDANRQTIDIYNMGWKNYQANVSRMRSVARRNARTPRRRPRC